MVGIENERIWIWLIGMSPFHSSNNSLPFLRIFYYYPYRAIELTNMSLMLTTLIRKLMVVTSRTTMVVAPVFGAMAAPRAGIIAANHEGKALEKGEVLKLGLNFMFGVRDDISGLRAVGMGFRNSGASSDEEGLIGGRGHGREKGRARCQQYIV